MSEVSDAALVMVEQPMIVVVTVAVAADEYFRGHSSFHGLLNALHEQGVDDERPGNSRGRPDQARQSLHLDTGIPHDAAIVDG